MKKTFVVLLLLLIIPSVVLADDSSSIQLLVPKTVYIGDTAEIRYVFRSEIDFFPEQKENGRKSTLSLSTDCPSFNSLSDKCLVKYAVLERAGYEYTLVLTIVPWQSGIVDFPPFDLLKLSADSLRTDHDDSVARKISFPIDLEAIAVDSILEKTGATSFRPPVPPLVVPGTTWIIYGLIILIIAIVVLALILIKKIPFIKSSYQSFFTTLAYRRNARLTIKHLRNLIKKEYSDSLFCGDLQNIMRVYLENRFNSRFTAETTGSIPLRFDELMGGNLSPEQNMCVQMLVELFSRTDYIRYAGGSADSLRLPAERYSAVLAPGERKSLVAMSVQTVLSFEGKSKEHLQGGEYAGV